MAKQSKSSGATPVVPNFKDVDKAATQAAAAAVAGGSQAPLVIPKDAKISTGDKGSWTRWTERATVSQAYRTVAKSGLLDVTVVVKLRQSEKNNGRRVFGHFYINISNNIPEKHEQMNERSIGAIVTLLVATGFMPAGGALKGTLLDKMFPLKNQPGTSSPLSGKAIIANVVQENTQQKDLKTGKLMVDDEGNKIKQKRDSVESFLPDAAAVAVPEDDDEEESGEEE